MKFVPLLTCFSAKRYYSTGVNNPGIIMEVKQIFLKALSAVNPHQFIQSSVSVRAHHLVVYGQTFKINKPVHIVGFGKAVQSMAMELEKLIGDENIAEGIISVPVGSTLHDTSTKKIRYIEGAAHNLPDKEAMQAALEIRNLALKLTSDDLLIVVISGGGSALLPLPKPGIQLEDKIKLTKDLASAGADIMELNTVRKRLSQLKGNGLAQIANPCPIISLILSDVIGDPLDFIASGPTVQNVDPIHAAKNILIKYNLLERQPPSIMKYLDEVLVTSKHPDNNATVHNFIIGNNRLATEAARTEALRLNYSKVFVLSNSINGNVSDVSKLYAQLARRIAGVLRDKIDPQELHQFISDHFGVELEQTSSYSKRDGDRWCVILGGETTVVVNGNGLGGRNQQLALEFAAELNEALFARCRCAESDFNVDISFLSCGTDGFDGPTDAAGAWVDLDLIKRAKDSTLKMAEFIKSNDCYSFFSGYKSGDCIVKTGHTGTNVMDLHILTVCKK